MQNLSTIYHTRQKIMWWQMVEKDRVRTLFQKQTSRTFPGLFPDSDWFFQNSEIHITFSLLSAIHFILFYLSLRDFQNFPGPVNLFQDFPVLENATIKFQDFPGFPGSVRTLERAGAVFKSWQKTGRCGRITLLPYLPPRHNRHEWVSEYHTLFNSKFITNSKVEKLPNTCFGLNLNRIVV